MRRRRGRASPPWALLLFALRYPGAGACEQLAAEVASLPARGARGTGALPGGVGGRRVTYVETSICAGGRAST